MRQALYVMQRLSPAQKAQVRGAAGDAFTLAFRDELTPAQQAEALENATAIFGEPTVEKVQKAAKLQWIQMTWAGADRYLKDPAFPHRVLVSNATGGLGVTVGEYAVAVILALYRQLPAFCADQRDGRWQPRFDTVSLEGKRALILGAGDVGTALARRLRPFGVHVTGVCRTARETPPDYDALYTLAQLETQLPLADIVIGCLPGTAQTAGLFDARRLRQMKPGALLVNVGRGSLIVTDDLVCALREGRLSGAALDVTDPEPLPPGHPLWAMPNVLLTPHIAGISFGGAPETEEKILAIFCDNLRRVAAGQRPGNLVDFQTGYRSQL